MAKCGDPTSNTGEKSTGAGQASQITGTIITMVVVADDSLSELISLFSLVVFKHGKLTLDRYFF